MARKRLSREKQDAKIQRIMRRPLPEGDPIEPDEIVLDDAVIDPEEIVEDEVDIDEETDPDEAVR